MSETPLNWDYIEKLDDNPPPKALPRALKTQKRYGGYLAALKRKGTTIEEDIMSRIINNHQDQQFIVTKNDFPYSVDKDIAHLVLWVNPLFASPNKSEKDTELAAREFIMSLISHEYTINEVNKNNTINEVDNNKIPLKVYSMFENNPKNRSVNNVRHFQLFIKNKNIGMLPIEKL